MNFTWLKDQWNKLPEKWRFELVSASHTVVSAMIVELLYQISVGGGIIPTQKEALLAIATAVLRSGQKSLVTFISSQISEKNP